MAGTVTPASAPVGSYAASVVYSKVLFARMITHRTFRSKITAPIPVDEWVAGLGRKESARGMPVVQIMDLMNTSGDQVTCDIVDRTPGKPIMGDNIARDKGVPISINRDSVFINQARKVIDVGGRMGQQRTPHELRKVGMALTMDYLNDLEDNLVMVHSAGARGDATGIEWKVPLSSDPDFATICVNPVLPPTQNRYVGLNAAITNPSQVTTVNTLSLNFFDDLRTINDTSPVPLQGVKLESMDGTYVEGEDSELLVSFISSEQWNQLQKDTSAQNWRTFLANATERLSTSKHPLFRNSQCGIWRDILICQCPRPIQFSQGSTIAVMNADGTTQSSVTAAVRLHRGWLMGAQAVAAAYASAKRWAGSDKVSAGSGGGQTNLNSPYNWVEKLEDGDNLLQIFTGVMNGYKKLRYTFSTVTTSGVPTSSIYDNGIFVFDSYVPQLRSVS